MNPIRAFITAACVLVCAASAMGAPRIPADNPVGITAVSTAPRPVHPGEVATFHFKIRIADGWHVYSVVPSAKPGPFATTLVIAGASVSPSGSLSESAAIRRFDPNFQTDVAYHEHEADFTASARIDPRAPAGPASAAASLRFQACNDRMCDPPVTIQRDIVFLVAAGPVRGAYAAPPAGNAPASPPAASSVRAPVPAAPASDLGSFLAAAFGAGLLALLTPCVFPLIPVTFGFFTKQMGATGSRLVAVAAVYAAGIVLSFTALGLVLAVTLGANGANRVAANPWFNIAFGVLFVVFAFAFFETFQLTLPAALQRFARPAQSNSGILGALFMGLAFVFAAFTCTAPFVGTLLVTAATMHAGTLLHPILGMAVFASALALPFLLIALFPVLLHRLPKSGAWMSRGKAILGFVELAYAVTYFIKADRVWGVNWITGPAALAIWAAIAVCGALYLIGALRVSRYQDDMGPLTFGRTAGIAAFLLVAGYCFWGLSGRPINANIGALLLETGSETTWSSDYDASLARARQENKPIFIDFTGYTCTNCRWMELNIFTKPDVRRELAKYVLVRLYTDGGPDANKNQALQIKIGGAIAQPLYAVLGPDGAKHDVRIGIENRSAVFAAFLQQGADAAASAAAAQPNVPPASAAVWQPYSASAYAAALASGKPVVIDFTADWCEMCHAIERTVFEDAAVKPQLAGFTTLRADLTDFDAPSNAAVEAKFGVVNLPTVVLLQPSGAEAAGTRVTGIVTTADFLGRLAKAGPR